MRDQLHRVVSTRAPAAVVLVRALVGGVFLSEGIQKFLYAEALGVGRFAKIGIPAPAVAMAHEARTDYAMLLGASFCS